MSTVADLLAAIDAEGSSSWDVADRVAALDETDPDTGRPLTLKQVSEAIWRERGVEWSPAVLGKYRATANAFPIGVRTPMTSFAAHEILRAHPEKLAKWADKNPGKVLTVENARALRGGGSGGGKPAPLPGRVKATFTRLEALVEEDPEAVLDALAAMLDQWRRKYAARIKKGSRRGPTAA